MGANGFGHQPPQQGIPPGLPQQATSPAMPEIGMPLPFQPTQQAMQDYDDNKVKEPAEEDLPVKRGYDKKKISAMLLERIRVMSQDRDEWLSRQVEFLSGWNEYLCPTRAGPWAGASDLHLPVTMEHCLTLHAHLLDVFFGMRPWFFARPREKMDRETVEMKEVFMHWALTSYVNYNDGIFPVIDEWLWEVITTGFGILKLRWECQYRMSLVVEDWLNPETGEVHKRAEKKRVKIFEGPVLELLRKEDVLMLGDYNDIDRMPCFAHRIWLSESDVNRRVEAGLYDKAAVKRIIAARAAKKDRISSIDQSSHDYRDEQDLNEGVITRDSHANEELFEIYEANLTYDLDDDGFSEEVILWVEAETGEIVRDTDLDKVSTTGRRPLFKGDLYKRPHRAYSMGLPELLYPYNKEIDAIHNQKIDFATITTIPWFLYNPASGMKNEEMRIGPGVGIPVDDVNNSVRFPTFQQSSGFHNREEDSLMEMAGNISGVSGPIAGQAPASLGAGRTATGMSSLLQRQNVRVDVFVKRLQYTFGRMLQELDAMMQVRLPDGVMYRVLGSDGYQLLKDDGTPVMKEMKTRFELRGQVDYEMLANSASANKELEFQKAMLRAQTMINPLDLQLGLQSPRTVYELRKSVLKAQGVVDPDLFLEKPDRLQKPLEAREEVMSCVQGKLPFIVMNDDHPHKIEVLKAFIESQEYAQGKQIGNIAANADAMFLDAIRKHEQFDQAMQAQAAQGNVTGLQISPSMSARVAGQVDQQTQQPVATSGMNQAPPPPQGERPEMRGNNVSVPPVQVQ